MTVQSRVHIHTHASGERGIFANAYLVETAHGVVAIDATLTVSESRSFRARLESLGKPLLAVLITHAHPDHVAGLTELVGTADVPIKALPAVDALMRASEEPKRAQWQPVYKEEWIDHWTFPTRLVQDGDAITFDGVTYRVHDLGPGGDCDANALWVIEPESRPAGVGDLVFNGLHAYMADDHVLAWLANLERARTLLSHVEIIYPGHGAPGALDRLDAQRAYLLAYCGAVKELAGGQPTLSEEAKGHLTARMEQFRPGDGLTFLIAHSADAVATELAGRQ